MKRVFEGFIYGKGNNDICLFKNKKDQSKLYVPCTYLFDAISEFLGYEYYDEHNDEFWGRKTSIDNVSMHAYYSSDKCDINDAQSAFCERVYGGELNLSIRNIGYSEWTITGYDVETATLGGHDLFEELYPYEGWYMHLVVEYN